MRPQEAPEIPRACSPRMSMFTRDTRTAQPSPLTRPELSESPERAEEENLE